MPHALLLSLCKGIVSFVGSGFAGFESCLLLSGKRFAVTGWRVDKLEIATAAPLYRFSDPTGIGTRNDRLESG